MDEIPHLLCYQLLSPNSACRKGSVRNTSCQVYYVALDIDFRK